ncbi:MAG: SAM-dependent methyltransferase [Candidatus Peregrinibacteria bacterium]|nr:SAM-dependent methyltransferase [Candidatus Peregrinibacteria bacterium]
MHENIAFLKGFLQHPGDISSVIPTSQIAVKRVIDLIDGSQKRVIVEYGPGTGVLMKQLLKKGKLTDDSEVILIEKTPEFADMLRQNIHDPRVKVFCDSAENVKEILQQCGHTHADYILSSIPFSIFSEDLRNSILENTRDVLSDDGTFIVYLFRLRVRDYLKEYFLSVHTDRELRNIPPLYIFQARR